MLFPQRLDEAVAQDDPVRRLLALLREVDWGPWERQYAGCGQPPIHPRYLAGAILYGPMHKLRTSRELEDAGVNRLDFMWLLEGFKPDHSTYANFRLRHETAIGDLSAQVARALVMQRHGSLLQLIMDGTRLRADSDRHGPRTAATIEMIIGELERRMKKLAQGDAEAAPQAEYYEGMAPKGDQQQSPEAADQEIARLQKKSKYQKALDIANERDARARKPPKKAPRARLARILCVRKRASVARRPQAQWRLGLCRKCSSTLNRQVPARE